MKILNKEKFKEFIAKESGISKEELEKKIEETKKKFPVISEDGLLLFICDELKVDRTKYVEELKIKDISFGHHNIKVVARVKKAHTIARENSPFILRLLLDDSTGEIWAEISGEKAKEYENIAINECVQIERAYVSERRNNIVLIVGEKGSIEKKEDCDLPPVKENVKKILQLETNERANVYGQVERVFPKTSEKSPHSFLMKDETSKIRIVDWKNHQDIKEGMYVKVENARVKENNGRKELHVDTFSRIVLNPPGYKLTDCNRNACFFVLYLLNQWSIRVIKVS